MNMHPLRQWRLSKKKASIEPELDASEDPEAARALTQAINEVIAEDDEAEASRDGPPPNPAKAMERSR